MENTPSPTARSRGHPVVPEWLSVGAYSSGPPLPLEGRGEGRSHGMSRKERYCTCLQVVISCQPFLGELGRNQTLSMITAVSLLLPTPATVLYS